MVTIHSVDEVDGRLFLTMELVSGQPLSEMIGRGGLALDKLLTIAVPLADAVSTAHARGITHRDLKPANVMVTADGQVKVLDFGLAKLLDVSNASDRMVTEAPDVITGQGRILGTIAYMSPEQAEGKTVDGRSDIFSLGVMLYEMATGVRPFKGDTSLSTLMAIMRDTPKSVTEINPTIPKELGRVIRRALSKDPDRRQQTGKGSAKRPRRDSHARSPHGQRIAYWGSRRNTVQRDLWTIAAGGGEPVVVSNDPPVDWSPAWSLDGRHLYFFEQPVRKFQCLAHRYRRDDRSDGWRPGTCDRAEAEPWPPELLCWRYVAGDVVECRPGEHRGPEL